MRSTARMLSPLLVGSCLLVPAAAQAETEPPAATLDLSYRSLPTHTAVQARLENGSGNGFLVVVSFGGTAFTFEQFHVLGTGHDSLMVDGVALEAAEFVVPPQHEFPEDFDAHYMALFFRDGEIVCSAEQLMSFNSAFCETLDFDFRGDGTPSQVGEEILEQYASFGLHVSAENNVPTHPHKCILFDSSMPTAGDEDLMTPGTGTGNDEPLGRVLIIAENDVDADMDGLVDVPDDENDGGTFSFAFDQPVTFCGFDIIDVDAAEGVLVRAFDSGGVEVGTTFVAPLDDNNVQSIGVTFESTSLVTIAMTGSAALGNLRFVPCPNRLDFDGTLTGIPFGLAPGTIVTNQIAMVEISADNAVPGHPDAAMLFDSASPTGDDGDLGTPGPGIGNDEALGMLLVIAENVVDVAPADGIVDVPDDERFGGTLTVRFGSSVTFQGGTVVDVDTDETVSFIAYGPGDVVLATIPLAALGDNSVQSVSADVAGVTRVDLVMSGSGGLANLLYCPEL